MSFQGLRQLQTLVSGKRHLEPK